MKSCFQMIGLIAIKYFICNKEMLARYHLSNAFYYFENVFLPIKDHKNELKKIVESLGKAIECIINLKKMISNQLFLANTD